MLSPLPWPVNPNHNDPPRSEKKIPTRLFTTWSIQDQRTSARMWICYVWHRKINTDRNATTQPIHNAREAYCTYFIPCKFKE